MSLVFKEWAPVIRALVAGRQTLLLRKGGIAEDRGRFDVKATRFWLLPTSFHAQREMIKPSARSFLDNPVTTLTISAYAEVMAHAFVTDWNEVQKLDSQHILTESTVRQRFDWGRQPGIHVIRTQLFTINCPFTVELSADQTGCKSWIEIEQNIDDYPGHPIAL